MPNYVNNTYSEVSNEKSLKKEYKINRDVEASDASIYTDDERMKLLKQSFLKTKDIDFDQTSEENEIYAITSFLERKGFITQENWHPPVNIGGKIVDFQEHAVIVECLINKQDKVFQIRKFPKELFDNYLHLEEGDLILIRIRLKAGSQRIDILDAKGMSSVKKEDFEYNGDWEGIDESLSKPLPKEW